MKYKIIPFVLAIFFAGSSTQAQNHNEGIFSSHNKSLSTRPALVQGKPIQVVFGKIPALETYFSIEGNLEINFEGQTYFYNNGHYFIYNGGRYLLVTPPLKLKVKDLPADKEQVGDTNYYSRGIFYKKTGSEYEVIAHPQGAIVYNLPIFTDVVTVGDEAYYEYLGVLYKRVFVNDNQAFEVVGELIR